jgi:Neuraminidase (sialidase)
MKYRTIAVFSGDKGKTWGEPVTVAVASAEASETGPCEADLARAANGDILCAMRSDGKADQKTTPCYLCRSSDEGQTWSKPQAILDRGVWPSLCVMRNGAVVCATGRPANWLVFSTDNGHTWQGTYRFQRGKSSQYNTVLEVAPDTILVIYDRQAAGQGDPPQEIVGTFFTIQKTPK